MPFLSDLRITPWGKAVWKLDVPLVYEGQHQVFTVPAGYVTDFATVPRSFVWLVRPYGPYTRAAVLHDYLITDAIPAGKLSSRDTDGMFRRVMREEGTSFALRWTMWAAVRAAAPFSARRRISLGVADYPLVLLIGVLAAPVYPAALLVALTLGLLKILGLRR